MTIQKRNVKAPKGRFVASLAFLLLLGGELSSVGNHNAAVSAFTSTTTTSLSSSSSRNQFKKTSTFVVQRSSAANIDHNIIQDELSAVLPKDEVKPLIRFKKDSPKEKIINSFGIWCAICSVLTAPPWTLAMTVVNAISSAFEQFDPNRALYDGTGKVWSKVFLNMIFSYPEITGDVEGLKEREGACLYVANHASWLDIPVLCTVLDPVFKFISKAELTSVPCIGQQLTGGKHILIDRDDRRSQLRTFKEGISWLKNGVPLMAFPEGKRSTDGKLMDFKGGMFSMAVKVGVPIVPITISNTHAVMPGNALFPVQRGDGGVLRVHVHDPIHPEGKSEKDIAEEVREAFLSKLPADQKPDPVVVMDEEEVSDVVVDKILSESKEENKKKQLAAP
mmetsp:Transcript_3501/g.4743  ORF Transcript_3501/g.4743 Transcript_3501/m.4743 type:complete len:392 (-) Transcript_3501:208-1383(-)|eukprot:CAMPEP_0185728576 /NCGR_PEP_ID=MMETSP1171-20130828/3895_1 /TAXON_ID=374046 /ORGANISM="Helicotheca tamensis, Strain CCMP826" /LENGTH=391 /DNA_ID=CAMNT_0028397301 /DNA_START=155 /DNA_END=1330 /DNA_ORIENTATION=+